eukprot:1838106-Pleurochrysis_carterae.AAC.3
MRRAGTATTVARQASVGVIRELSTSETAHYSLMTARTVGSETKCKTAKQESHAKPNERFRNNSVVNCEDTAVLRSSRPPSGGWRLDTKYRGYSGEQADLTGTFR